MRRTRLPHAFLTGRYDGLSTLDLVRDGGYLLLAGLEGQRWARAGRALDPGGAFLRVALLSRQAGSATVRPADACGIGDHSAMLVRPDHVVTWHTTQATANTTAAVAEVTRRALQPARLCRGTTGRPDRRSPGGARNGDESLGLV
ncbi:hypothetical protein [Streptomyces sp. NBC_01089]|uniref:aromatic-ring hydroxylase C-terminal domain-containing protein n=1 Tax=Streptomyces sp. NBC_01089 TaxID=2903747 RepID=UPI0038689B86|nr:hypothetical protein OG510_17450 [Streptomyces sp. NBC_01089]